MNIKTLMWEHWITLRSSTDQSVLYALMRGEMLPAKETHII